MNTLVESRVSRPCPKTQTAAEIDRAYARLAAAIVDVPDEIILAMWISKLPDLETGGSVISH